jgi:hypothetical protein
MPGATRPPPLITQQQLCDVDDQIHIQPHPTGLKHWYTVFNTGRSGTPRAARRRTNSRWMLR